MADKNPADITATLLQKVGMSSKVSPKKYETASVVSSVSSTKEPVSVTLPHVQSTYRPPTNLFQHLPKETKSVTYQTSHPQLMRKVHQPVISQSTGGSHMDFAKAMTLVCAFILAGVSAYIATHDTQPLKAQTEKLFYQNEMEKQKTAQEEERTKQMALAVKQGIRLPVPSSASTVPTVSIPSGGKVILSPNMTFAFRGESGEAKAATIMLPGLPKKTSGSYMLVVSQGNCKMAWSNGWSSDPSPCDVNTFLQSVVSREGVVHRVDVHTKGEAVFTM